MNLLSVLSAITTRLCKAVVLVLARGFGYFAADTSCTCLYLSRFQVERYFLWKFFPSLFYPTVLGRHPYDKLHNKLWVSKQGVDCAATLNIIDRRETPDVVADLPANFVLKPVGGWQNICTYVVQNGREQLRNKPFNLDEARRAIRAEQFDHYIIEEMLHDEHDKFPLVDYKFFCFKDKIIAVDVIHGRRRLNESQYVVEEYTYNDDFALIDPISSPSPDNATHHLKCISKVVPSTNGKPACWKQMVADVKKIGGLLDCFARIDMYATKRGPVFGEFCFFLISQTGTVNWTRC